ncbi:diguanylate cyclase domain-containing protein [Sphingomonas sp. DT-51]|uniref:GGDEF domain-containing protein n=1 Tax=Sphingomonas sp. DT-51 TaxID=3396165 RepID=UPI003F1C3DFA
MDMVGPQRAKSLRVLDFLDDHRLAHNPLNYSFAYHLLVEADLDLSREVERITDGSLRIAPEEIEGLMARLRDRPAPKVDVAPELDRLTVQVLDIIGDAASATGDLNRDLVGAASSLLSPDGQDIRRIIGAMIERTSRAEANLAAATGQAEALRDELATVRDVASRDRLTGLLNRQAMEERLSAAIAGPNGCALAYVDVDHFKTINDTHGHAVGDRVLKVVAHTLSETCAPHEVARWGGEEFLVLMAGVSAEDGADIIDTARRRLVDRRLKLRETDTPLGMISFSAGVASSEEQTALTLVEIADALLYEAKRGGRNKVLARRGNAP